jgi:hypothetical protein
MVALLVLGCAHSYHVKPGPVANAASKLVRLSPVWVALAADGAYGGKPYLGSGGEATRATVAAFSEVAVRVDAGTRVQPELANIEEARSIGATLLVIPTILHWEDRATEWSGIRDKMSLRVLVIDVASSQPIGSAVLEGRSRWATFGGDHPQDLLRKPLSDYVRSLY